MGLNNIEEVTCKYRQAKSRFFERNSVFKKFNDIDEQRRDEIKNEADTC